MKSLEKEGISVKEFFQDHTRTFHLVAFDERTGMQYQHQINEQEAREHPEIVLHVLRQMQKSLMNNRGKVMGVDWTEEKVSMARMAKASAGMAMPSPNWREHTHIPTHDRGFHPERGRTSGTNFKRLGEEVFLEEGRNFEEPLDALRISVARWLKN